MPTLLIIIIASSILFSVALPYFIRKRSANKNQTHSFGVATKANQQGTISNIDNKPLKNVKSKKRPLISIVVALSFFAIPLFIVMNGCESDFTSATFAIEKNGKNYIYSSSEFLVNNAIKQGEVPPSLNSNLVYFIDENVYMSPNNLEHVVNILSGNYKIIDKDELSYSGYAVSDSSNVYNLKVQNKAGAKIGETQVINAVTLSSKSHRSKSMEIMWKVTPELQAIKNCSVENIWVITNPYPGKTVGNWEDDILVNLNDINSFYGNSFELVFDEESSVLYFKKINNN